MSTLHYPLAHSHVQNSNPTPFRDTQHLLAPEADSSLKDDGGDLPLHAAARIVHVPAVALLLANGADANTLELGWRYSHGCTGTICWCFFGECIDVKVQIFLLIMQQLLESGADSTATDCNLHRTSFEWAVLQSHTSLMQLLLQRETFGVTRKNLAIYLRVLDYAVCKDDRVIVKNFLE